MNVEDTGVFWQGLKEVNFIPQNGQTKKYQFNSLNQNSQIKGTDVTTLGSLEGLVDDGLKKRFQHSFYYYMGSISQPGCQDNVKRIVMYEGIQVDPKSYNTLKEKVLDGFNWKENNRMPVNQGTGTMKDRYIVYKHIDISNKASCPTREILKKYTDPNYVAKLSSGEYKSYLELIKEANSMETKYSNAYKAFESKIEGQKAQEGGNKVSVNFNRKVEMTTNMHHVHKIPKTLVNKLFSTEKPKQMQNIVFGSTNNDLRITYLGKNKQEYTDNIKTIEGLDEDQKKLKEKANKVIAKHDDDKIKQDKQEQIINQDKVNKGLRRRK